MKSVSDNFYDDPSLDEDPWWAEAVEQEIEDRDRAWVDPAWWNSDNDHYTSDNDWMEDEWLSEELSAQDYQDIDDWYREMREDQLFDIELSANVPWSKVRGFIEDAKGWKSYDTKNGGVESNNRKRFCNYRGYQVQQNNVDRIIDSMVKPFATIASIEAKLKSNPKWKHHKTFRMVAGWRIDDMREGGDITWHWNNSKYLRKFMIVDGYIVLK